MVRVEPLIFQIALILSVSERFVPFHEKLKLNRGWAKSRYTVTIHCIPTFDPTCIMFVDRAPSWFYLQEIENSLSLFMRATFCCIMSICMHINQLNDTTE